MLCLYHGGILQGLWTKLCLITIVYKIQKAYKTTKQIKYRLLTFPLKSQSFCGNI